MFAIAIVRASGGLTRRNGNERGEERIDCWRGHSGPGDGMAAGSVLLASQLSWKHSDQPRRLP